MNETISDTPIHFAEIASSAPAASLFARTFGHPPPPEPHHVAAWLRTGDGMDLLACYVHFYPFGDSLLGGGACVDKRVLRRLDADARTTLRDRGGIYRLTLEFAIEHFAPDYAAIFGYCGDRAAEVIDRAAGFVSTEHEHLIVRWLRDVDQDKQEELITRANTAGAF